MKPEYRVFILEDDPTIQFNLSSLLKKSGHTIAGASSSGKDALQQIPLCNPEIIFVDIGLPDISGIDVIKELLKERPYAIVVISSDDRPHIVTEASQAGALAYIVKPFDMAQIQRAIIVASVQFQNLQQLLELNRKLTESIDQRKVTEAMLSDSELMFRTLAENTQDIIMRHDKDGKCLYANPAFEKIIGIAPARVIGTRFFSFIDDPDKQCYSEATLQKVIDKGASIHFEISFDNSGKVFDWWMVPEFDSNNNTHSVISTIRDTSELRDARERLYQLEKMQAIGQLAGGIAHDFNNKLGAILGYADILLDTLTDDDRRKKYVDAIIKAAQFASDLTTQLLAYARKGKVKNILLDMHQIIDELVRFLSSSFDRKIILVKKLSAESPFIFGDPLLLKNAFLNVALNANDAMPDGGTLTFETEQITFTEDFHLFDSSALAPGTYLRVRITDTGTGITEDDIERIFEPFFTTKEIGKGTGLGLPAVYGIVKSHAGSIDVQSEPGKGAVFDIYFPSAASEDLLRQKEITIGESDGLPTILVVDDNELIREMAAEMLNNLRYNVIVCRSGYEAVKLYGIHHAKIDLVLIDIIMPGIDGYETYTQMKNLNPWIKAFFISGYSISEKTNKFLAEGVLGIIQKPFRISEIKNALEITLHADQNISNPTEALDGHQPLQ
jgi:PAS domain S-box-containing protein